MLTEDTPGLAKPLSASNVRTLKRTDGTSQVTYRGKPLYLFSLEGIVPSKSGPGFVITGSGNGLKVGGGSFQLVTP